MTEERPTPTLALAALALTLFLYLTAKIFTAGAMLLLGLTQAGIAIAPSLTWVIVLRGISALCHGAVWASAPSVAAALLPGRPGRATASVFLGSALGNVLGAPLVAALSAAASWHLAAAVLALLAAGCGVLLTRSIPGHLRPERERGGTAKPGRQSVLAAVAMRARAARRGVAHCRHVPPRSRPARDRLPLRLHPVRGRDGRGQP